MLPEQGEEQCQFCVLAISETHLPLTYLISATLLKATIVWNLDHSMSLPASTPTPVLHVAARTFSLKDQFDYFD